MSTTALAGNRPILLLDTNACIGLLRGRAPELQARLAQIDSAEYVVSVVVLAELLVGVAKAREPARAAAQVGELVDALHVVDFTPNCAREYADIRAHLEARGEKIGELDTLIAATARRIGATVITRNLREFSRVPGLTVEPW